LKKVTSKYKDDWNGHGLEDDLEVEGLEGCGTNKASGGIKMSCVEKDWRREAHEVPNTFGTSLNPIFARKFRVQGSKEPFDFWYIQAVH
jgi:hypothetical protein